MEVCRKTTNPKVHYKHVWKGSTSPPIQGFNNQQYNNLYKKRMFKTYQFDIFNILKNPSYSIINIHKYQIENSFSIITHLYLNNI